LLPILKMIDQGFVEVKIAETLQISRAHIYYYLKRAKNFGYIKDNPRVTFKPIELTQAGKNFLDQYTNPVASTYTNRLENVRFKAPVHRMPTMMVDWKKVEMNNWIQYGSEIDNIKVHLNDAKSPTIEFLPSPVDGDDPYKLYAMALYDCHKAAEKLEGTLGIEIGRLEPSSSSEWVVYDPVANLVLARRSYVTLYV